MLYAEVLLSFDVSWDIEAVNPLLSPNHGGIFKRLGDTPKTPVLPRKDTSIVRIVEYYQTS